MIVRVQLSSVNSAANSGNNHTLTIPFEGVMHSFNRQGAYVFRNGRYQPESPLKLLPPNRTAIETVTSDKIRTVWNELDYRVDVCRITKCAHIEHL